MKERGLRPNGYFPLMRQPLFLYQCDFVTEKCFVMWYDKATIKKEVVNMKLQTYLVAAGAASLREAIQLFWTFRVPWDWTYTAGTVSDWVAQFSFGFYSLMLTSLLLGLIVMVLYKPRTWCAFCPMGTMTQSICKLKSKNN